MRLDRPCQRTLPLLFGHGCQTRSASFLGAGFPLYRPALRRGCAPRSPDRRCHLYPPRWMSSIFGYFLRRHPTSPKGAVRAIHPGYCVAYGTRHLPGNCRPHHRGRLCAARSQIKRDDFLVHDFLRWVSVPARFRSLLPFADTPPRSVFHS